MEARKYRSRLYSRIDEGNAQRRRAEMGPVAPQELHARRWDVTGGWYCYECSNRCEESPAGDGMIRLRCAKCNAETTIAEGSE